MDSNRDLLNDRLAVAMVYGLPTVAIVASGNFALSPAVRGLIWAIALLVMSGGCLANALRCRRVHCYFTAPFLFIMALASGLYGFGGARQGAGGWNILAAVTLVGAIALYYLPERIAGRYRNLL